MTFGTKPRSVEQRQWHICVYISANALIFCVKNVYKLLVRVDLSSRTVGKSTSIIISSAVEQSHQRVVSSAVEKSHQHVISSAVEKSRVFKYEISPLC